MEKLTDVRLADLEKQIGLGYGLEPGDAGTLIAEVRELRKPVEDGKVQDKAAKLQQLSIVIGEGMTITEAGQIVHQHDLQDAAALLTRLARDLAEAKRAEASWAEKWFHEGGRLERDLANANAEAACLKRAAALDLHFSKCNEAEADRKAREECAKIFDAKVGDVQAAIRRYGPVYAENFNLPRKIEELRECAEDIRATIKPPAPIEQTDSVFREAAKVYGEAHAKAAKIEIKEPKP